MFQVGKAAAASAPLFSIGSSCCPLFGDILCVPPLSIERDGERYTEFTLIDSGVPKVATGTLSEGWEGGRKKESGREGHA